MSVVTVFLERIVCRNTTEAGHDEVYYLGPVHHPAKRRGSVRRRPSAPARPLIGAGG
jgi:hypothetical protein